MKKEGTLVQGLLRNLGARGLLQSLISPDRHCQLISLLQFSDRLVLFSRLGAGA